MNNTELLNYLRIAQNAELAVLECQSLVDRIKKQDMLPRRPRPASPVAAKRITYRERLTTLQEVCRFFFGIAGAVIGICIAVAIERMTNASNVFLVLVYLFGIMMLTVFSYEEGKYFYIRKEKKRVARENAKIEQDVAQQNAAAEAEYQAKLSAWNKVADCVQANQRDLISNQERLLAVCKARLQQVYSRPVLHESFHNLTAVNAIRYYLETGICTELTGPHGAYAQYTEDLRAERIVNSVNDLREATMRGFAAIAQGQQYIAKQISRIDQNTREISSQMEAYQSKAQNYYQRMEEQIAKGQAITQQANQSMMDGLARIHEDLQLSNHNHYIALRENEISAYLLERP